MANIDFDLSKAEKTLTDAGLEEKAAEAIVAVVDDIVPDDVATKRDLDNLSDRTAQGFKHQNDRIEQAFKHQNDRTEQALKNQSDNLNLIIERESARLETRIAQSETRMTNKGLVAVGVIISVLGFLIVASRFISGNQ